MAPLLSEEESAMDPYALLGVKVDASEKDIQKAYRKQTLLYHPDRNPDKPDAPQKFHDISVALELLLDPAKRAYLDSKLDEDRRRKEKMAGMEKRRRGMVDDLIAREEDARKAKIARFQRMQDENEEDRIKAAGREMREQAQARAQADARAHANVNSTMESGFRSGFNGFGSVTGEGSGIGPLQSGLSEEAQQRRDGKEEKRPDIEAADVTLTLQFPALNEAPPFLASPDTLTDHLRQRYGPVEHVLIREAKAGEASKKKGNRAVVEFKTSNWDGCWECWKDHEDSKRGRALVPKTKVKWAKGEPPAWLAWAERQGSSGFVAQADRTPKPAAAGGNGVSSFPTFISRPQKPPTVADDLESTTLLRMRQLERQRMEERLRREEEEEA